MFEPISIPYGAKMLFNTIKLVTYWRSFEEHEKSRADEIFKARFSAMAEMCTESKELGYEMRWQGAAGA